MNYIYLENNADIKILDFLLTIAYYFRLFCYSSVRNLKSDMNTPCHESV